MRIQLTKEFTEDNDRIYAVNVDLTSTMVEIEYGFTNSDELTLIDKTIEVGKAGRTVEEEAVIFAVRKVKAKLADEYLAEDEDELEAFLDLENVVADLISKRKADAKAEKDAEKAKAKAKEDAEKAEAKVKSDAEKEKVKAEKAKAKEEARAERDAERVKLADEKAKEKARKAEEKEQAKLDAEEALADAEEDEDEDLDI